MIRLCLNPVPLQYSEENFVYWEYELEEFLRKCLVSLQQVSVALEQALGEEADPGLKGELHLILEEGRIKIWIPGRSYSEDLFQHIEQILREKIHFFFEEMA